MTPNEKRKQELAEAHGREYFTRNDLPGPGSTHDQIFCAGYDCGYSDAKDESVQELAYLRADFESLKNSYSKMEHAWRLALGCAEKAESERSVIIAEIETLKLQNLTAQKEITRLNRIIAKELSENDELGCEYTYVNALKAEVSSLSVKLQRTVNAAYHALLEMTAWMGIPEKKRETQINHAMENVKYCAEHDLRHMDESQAISALKAEIKRLKIWSSDSHVTDLEDELTTARKVIEEARGALRASLGWFALWNDNENMVKWPKYVGKCEEALAKLTAYLHAVEDD